MDQKQPSNLPKKKDDQKKSNAHIMSELEIELTRRNSLQTQSESKKAARELPQLPQIRQPVINTAASQIPLSNEQDLAYKKLIADIDKINKKDELSNLVSEIRDYFDNRLFYDQKKTQALIMNLRSVKISVPKCLYVNDLSLMTLENISNEFLKEMISHNLVYNTKLEPHEIEQLGKKLLKNAIEANLNQGIKSSSGKHKCGYMLKHEYMNSLVDIQINQNYCVVSHSLLVVIKLDKNTSGKYLFSIPGYIHTVFEITDLGLKLKAITASNSVLLKLVTGNLTECNDTTLETMVAQAKKEESPEVLDEWYKAQAKIFFAKEFSEKYQGIFNCADFKQEFAEEAREFFGLSDIWDKLGQFIGQVGSGLGKLFLDEDEKTPQIIYSEDYTEEYKFIRNFYSVIHRNKSNSNFEKIKIPQPLPTISLDYNNDSLCIAISHQAEEFIKLFKEHNKNLKFIDFEDTQGNIRAVFGRVGLKEFLVACKVPTYSADEMVQNLYKVLHERKYKHVLTLEELKNSSNSGIGALKSLEWMYITINDDGGALVEDINRNTQIDHRDINPGKNKQLIPNIINGYARKFPLLNQYKFTHSQKCGYLFSGAIEGYLARGKSKTSGDFMIAKNNSSTNIEFTETSATCVTNNNLLIIFDMYNKKGSALLFSIPGHIQTTFEMVGEYQLKAISSRDKNPIPTDITLRNSPQKLYLYLNEDDVLTYAVYDVKTKEIKRMIITDNELRQTNAELIRKHLKKRPEDQGFDKPENRDALLIFLKITEKAGYPILGLKLKQIETSNSALRDLVFGNFEKCNEEILAEIVARAKKEEPKESLYEWYKAQAVIFFHDNFGETHKKAFDFDEIERKFYAEVQQFLSVHYKNSGDKFYQFIEEVHELVKADERLLKEATSQKSFSLFTVESETSTQALQSAFNLFLGDIKGQEKNTQNKSWFQRMFLSANKGLVEKVEEAIINFIMNPHKQFFRFFLEKHLFELALTLKVMGNLKDDESRDSDTLSPLVGAILEEMIGRIKIKGLEMQHIQSIRLLLDDWNNGWDNEVIIRRLAFPKRVLEVLLNQVRLHFPLSQEQSQAYTQLKEAIKLKNKDSKLNSLNMKVDDYFENRLFSDQKKTKELIGHLEKADIGVPQCLLLPIAPIITKPRPLPQPLSQNTNTSPTKNSSISQRNPVSLEFTNTLSGIISKQGSGVVAGQQNTQSNQDSAKLLNGLCNQEISEIDKFREVLAKEFDVKQNDISVRLDVDDKTICIVIPGVELRTFNGLDALKENFSKLDGFNQVDVQKLYQELSEQQRMNNDYGQDSSNECRIS